MEGCGHWTPGAIPALSDVRLLPPLGPAASARCLLENGFCASPHCNLESKWQLLEVDWGVWS